MLGGVTGAGCGADTCIYRLFTIIQKEPDCIISQIAVMLPVVELVTIAYICSKPSPITQLKNIISLCKKEL